MIFLWYVYQLIGLRISLMLACWPRAEESEEETENEDMTVEDSVEGMHHSKIANLL